MVVHDFHFFCASIHPVEAYAPLIVDPNRVPACEVALEGFQLVARRSTKVSQHNGSIDHLELAAGDLRMPDGKPFGLSPANTMRVRLSEKALIMDL